MNPKIFAAPYEDLNGKNLKQVTFWAKLGTYMYVSIVHSFRTIEMN
jgi:hypothetical protein